MKKSKFGGRPRTSPGGEIRDERVSIFFSEVERLQAEENARLCGLPLPTFLRHIALGQKTKAPLALGDIELFRELSRTASNINQIAVRFHLTRELDGNALSVLKELQSLLAENLTVLRNHAGSDAGEL